MPTLFWDIETRSTVPLEDAGAWRYAADPTSEVLCVGYAVDDSDVQIWTPGSAVPEEFIAAARDTDWLIVAHNDAFERAIEELILAPRYGWPIVPIERHRCTMAMALASALPAALDTVAEVLELSARKDDQGARLMRMLSRPRKPRAGEDPAGIHWHDDPEKLERLYAYCRQDIEVERELYHRLPPLSDAEQTLWALDATINRRGFHTDGALLEAASRIAAAAGQAAHGELTRITDGALVSTDQVAALLTWLTERGCAVKDVRKPTLKAALRRKELDPIVRRVIGLRLGAAHAAAAKIDSLLAWRCHDGRVRGTLRYHGAGTGRWTGHGPQPQNFKRDGEDIEAKRSAVISGDLQHVQERYPQPLEIVGDIARAMICAAPEHRLLVGDFSGIESRVLAWVAGQQSKLDQWAKFDRTGDPKDEPYYLLGRSCGQPEETARKIGKTADLAFGYMGGPGAWDRLAPDDSSSEADKKRYQQTWRSLHPQTVNFWRGIDRAAIVAVRKPDTTFNCRQLAVIYIGGEFLRIRLPSCRLLCYPFPRLAKGKFGDAVVMFKDNAAGKWVDCRFGQGAYGGLWTENIVQAVSRDLLAVAMQRLEAAGYHIVLHVHDEIVAEAPTDFGSVEEFQRLITTLPDWAEGLPIAAKVRNGARFSKSESAGYQGAGQEQITHPPFVSVEPEVDHDPAVENSENSGNSEGSSTAMRDRDDDHAQDDHAPNGKTDSGNSSGGASTQHQHYPKGERRRGRRIATYFYQNHLKGPHTRVEKWRSSTTARAQYPQFFWFGGRWVSQKPKGWVKVPYRLPELLEALAKDPSTDVFLPEGEKDTDTIRTLGLVATTNSGGATPLKAKVGKWAPELNKWLSGIRRLFILADNDDVGRVFAREKARALETIVPDVRIILFPDVPDGEDVSYWLNELGHSKADLLARCEAAERWQDSGTLESIRASAVTMEVIDWLWPDRFALGEIGLLVGLPDEGKGQILNYIAARITRRGLEWPNGEGYAPQGNVILLTSEDNIKKTVTPRLVAAGADCDRIEIIKMVRDIDKEGKQRERMFSLIDDLQRLQRKIVEVGNVIAVLIDPISAYLGIGKVDSYRGSDVRAVLSPLKALAEDMLIAVIGIMHFNKKIDITNVLLRTQDSLAFVAAPRHVFGVIDDADNNRKLLVRAKNNLVESGQKRKSLAFHFEVQHVGVDPRNNKPIIAPFIVWEPGYVDISATEALQAASENKSPGEREKAKDLLLMLLAEGRSMPVDDIKDTAEGHGISWRTMRRAGDDLKVVVDKDRSTPKGKWFWKLP